MKYRSACPVCMSRYSRLIFSSPCPLPSLKTLNKVDYEVCFLCGVVYPSDRPSPHQLHLYYKYHPDTHEPNHAKRGDQVLNFFEKKYGNQE